MLALPANQHEAESHAQGVEDKYRKAKAELDDLVVMISGL
jgi:hypothetical protein